MKKQLILFMMFLASTLYAAALFATDSAYYVQSIKAQVRLEPSFKSKIIAEIVKGKMLTSTGREGSWVKVKVDGKDGYIPYLLLSTHPPLEKAVAIKADDSEIKQNVRRRASSFSSAAAARGLTKEERQREGLEDSVDYNAVKKMESLSLPADEVTKLGDEGKQ
jgi:uncharacterized protein YgiM (DUF1202 family)